MHQEKGPLDGVCVCVMLGLIVLYVRRKLVIDHAVGRSLAQAADTFSITA